MDYLDHLEQQETADYSERVRCFIEDGYDEETARQKAYEYMTNGSGDNEDYAIDDEIDRTINLYNVVEKEFQVAACAYMYGESLNEAEKTRETLSEDKIADACDYMFCNGLPGKEKQVTYQSMVDRRHSIEENHGLSPLQAIVARDDMNDLVLKNPGEYDLKSEKGQKAACDLRSVLEQSNLSSRSEAKMRVLDEMAKHAGLIFRMTNESAYTLPNALVKPQFELVDAAEDQDFAEAVANISENKEQLSHQP